MGAAQDPSFEFLPPRADSLVESLRGVGYSLETAAADVVDNSIAARAQSVWLQFWWDGPASFASFLDDGIGMSEDELVTAMRFGSRNPGDERAATDLGRFGLGLKTASLSQCRRLTVATKKDGTLVLRRWDLDRLGQDWRLYMQAAPGSGQLLASLERLSHGTIVLWERLDRLVQGASVEDSRSQGEFLKAVERVERHLGMVFHRYLEGPKPVLKIYVNGETAAQLVEPWDPFLRDHPATSVTPVERIQTRSGYIEVCGFVLPHHDRLDRRTASWAGGPDGWTAQQGFYVYRNQRLMVPGSWMGLGSGRAWTKEEPYKLARISVEIPSAADNEWAIDIKKSTATPPTYIRPRLQDLADRVRQDARRVFAHRGQYGQRAATPNLQRIWQAIQSGQDLSYRVNRSHPLISQLLRSDAPQREILESALTLIEQTVPVHRIWLDTVEQGDVPRVETRASTDVVITVLEPLFQHLTTTLRLTPEEARERLLRIEPFQNYPDLVEALA